MNGSSRCDTVQLLVGSLAPGSWWMDVEHAQQLGKIRDDGMKWHRDRYHFEGVGAVTDEVLAEVVCCVNELIGYSVERIAGLQLALF